MFRMAKVKILKAESIWDIGWNDENDHEKTFPYGDGID